MRRAASQMFYGGAAYPVRVRTAYRCRAYPDDTQASVLTLVFKIADDHGLLLLDLKDLQAMLQHVGDSAKDYQTQYGNISAASIGTIQRGLVAL